MCTLEQYRGKEEKTDEILITGMEFTSICPDRLQIFTNCKILKILKTNLKNIPCGIENLKNLENFQFCENTCIGKDEDIARLAGLKKLKSIHLQKNNIKNIVCFDPAYRFVTRISTFVGYNTSIAKLFSYLPFKKSFANFFSYFLVNTNFAALKELNISDNKISNIPDWVFTLKTLEKLNLAGNTLINIPEIIGSLSNLTELNLAKNYIEKIPNEICHLNYLKECDFSYNVIHNLPVSIFRLTNLRDVNISNNKLEALFIPNAGLDNLSVINLQNNNITNFMIEKNALPNLTYLNASNNKMKKLVHKFVFPEKLVVLQMNNNLFEELPQLQSLNNLTMLDVSHNRLLTLPSAICSFKSLEIVHASDNCLKELPLQIGNLESLKMINLDTNSLSMLPFSFSNLKNVFKLDLSNNLFKKIPYEILNIVNLKQFIFDGNLLENLVDTDYITKPISNISTDENGNKIQLESNTCEKTVFSLSKLKKMSFDNNKITEISKDIKFLKNLTVLSLKNNEIKTVPEEIGELQNLIILNLESNFLQNLPFSTKKLKNQKLTQLQIKENLIPCNDTAFGLGIDSIIKLNFPTVSYYPQYPCITIDDVVINMEKDCLHWNFEELKSIKLPVDLSKFAKLISDKQLRKVWRVVLKYFLVTEDIMQDQDSESSDEDNIYVSSEIDYKISKITASDAFKDIKANSYKNVNKSVASHTVNAYLPLYKKVGNFLKDNSTPKTGNPLVTSQMQELLKNNIKAIFYKFLEKIEEDNSNLGRLELIKIALTELCENKILTCIDGQLEGLQYYYSMFYSTGNEVTNNSIIDFIRNTIAANKELTFISVTNGNNGVHDISRWRAIFKDLLGIQHSFDDPYSNSFLLGNSKHKTGIILNDFFKNFTVENVIFDILNKINENMVKLNEAVSLLKHILKIEQPLVDDYTLYMNVIEKYFEFESISGYSELQPTKLKKNGIIKILLHLQILKENQFHYFK